MRWVFYGLLLVNAVFFVWQSFQATNQGERAEVLNARLPDSVIPIRLLSEVEKTAEDVLEHGLGAARCDVYGPFFSRAESQSFLGLLRKKGVKGFQQEELVRLKPYFRLYIKPFASTKEVKVMLNRLRGHQLHAELITEGRLRNGIELGNFESQYDIQRIEQKALNLGLSVESEEMSRDYRQFWAYLNPGSEALIKGKLRSDLIDKFPEIFHQEKSCKPVASSE